MADECHPSECPPSPPPIPPPPAMARQPAIKLSKRVSPFIKKLQAAPHGYFFESATQLHPVDHLAPPCGSYFFYGSLMSPPLLRDVLSLPTLPKFRPAKVIGYSLRLWGQYPALVDGETGEVVEGMLYDVMTSKDSARLAEYETSAYWPTPCLIYVMEGDNERAIDGTTFKYVGNPMDISEGTFDLDS